MRTRRSADRAPWLLLPAALLTLSGVTLLAPRRAAQAAPRPAPAPKPVPPMAAYDDGDGDELLEHWGDPKYGKEARVQIAGMAAGFVLLGTCAALKRAKRRPQAVPAETPIHAGLRDELRKAA